LKNAAETPRFFCSPSARSRAGILLAASGKASTAEPERFDSGRRRPGLGRFATAIPAESAAVDQ
jgi:hypothetical protein